MRFRLFLALPVLALVAACGAATVSDLPASTTPPTPTATTPAPSPTPTALVIEVIDVGQGASTLIQGPEKNLLVDGGDEDASPRVLEALGSRHLGGLDYVVATHPHADHIGSLDSILIAWPPALGVYDNGETLATAAFTNYKNAAVASPGGRNTITIGQVLDLGQGAKATCVAVGGKLLDGTVVAGVSDPNDLSVALLVEWGDFRFVVGGDLGGGGSGVPDLESPLAPQIGDIDVLQVNHHGSSTSTNSTWLNTLKPEVAIVSDGDGNTYGHPDADVLARLTGTDASVTIPPPDLFLTEKGSAGNGFNGAGSILIVAQPNRYVIGSKGYDALAH